MKLTGSSRGFGWLELALVGAAAAVLTGVATSNYVRQSDLKRSLYYTKDGVGELAPIAHQYGPNHFSRNWEEWLVRDFFKDRRDGVFVDVGANHFQLENNTYYLEKELGWSGIAIDALAEFGPDYVRDRPRTRFLALFVSDTHGENIPFFVPEANKLVASADRAFTVKEGFPGDPRQVPTTTLNVVLDQAGISAVDYLSMDIELAEPKALRGFDIERFKPQLVCIEAHPEVRQEILDYFTRHRYVVVGKYLRADTQNLYFMPLK